MIGDFYILVLPLITFTNIDVIILIIPMEIHEANRIGNLNKVMELEIGRGRMQKKK